jgi:hypothetical protein
VPDPCRCCLGLLPCPCPSGSQKYAGRGIQWTKLPFGKTAQNVCSNEFKLIFQNPFPSGQEGFPQWNNCPHQCTLVSFSDFFFAPVFHSCVLLGQCPPPQNLRRCQGSGRRHRGDRDPILILPGPVVCPGNSNSVRIPPPRYRVDFVAIVVVLFD